MDLLRLGNYLKENILLITIMCYSSGILYFTIYYEYYDIPFIYYTSLNDVLLYTLKFIGILFLYMIFCEFFFKELLGSYIRSHMFANTTLSDDEIYAKVCQQLVFVIPLIFKIASIFKPVIDQVVITLVVAPIITSFIYNNSLLNLNSRNIKKNILVSAVVIILLSIITILNNQFIKVEKQIISFELNKVIYDTSENKNLFFLGETSSHIFMRDDSLNKSMVFMKSEVKQMNYRGWIVDDKIKSSGGAPRPRRHRG